MLNFGKMEEDEYADEELCVAKSFSLKRKLVNGIRIRAGRLNMPMSVYVAMLVHNDLLRGLDAPLSFNPGEVPLYQKPKRGVAVDLSEF